MQSSRVLLAHTHRLTYITGSSHTRVPSLTKYLSLCLHFLLHRHARPKKQWVVKRLWKQYKQIFNNRHLNLLITTDVQSESVISLNHLTHSLRMKPTATFVLGCDLHSSLSRTLEQLFLASFSVFIATTMQCSYKALHISCLILHSNRFHYGTTGQMTLAEKHHTSPEVLWVKHKRPLRDWTLTQCSDWKWFELRRCQCTWFAMIISIN